MKTLPPLLGPPRRALLARLLAIGLAQGLLTVGIAWLIRRVFDGAMGNALAPISLGLAATALAGTAIVSGLLRMRERIDAEELGQSWVYELRNALFNRLVRSPSRAGALRGRGGILVRFTSDLAAVRQWISLGLARLLVSGLTIFVAAGVLGFIEPRLAAVVIGAAVTAAGALVLIAARLREAIAATRRQRVRLVARISDTLHGLDTVRACGAERRERRRLQRRGRKLWLAMRRRAAWAGGLRGVSEAGTALAATGAVIVGAWGVSQNAISAGTVVAAMAVISILLPQFRQLSRVYEYWQAASVALDNLQRQLDFRAQIRSPRHVRPAPPIEGELYFENVTVPGALEQVSAVAKVGQRVVIVGPNGAGKTTLLCLIPRLLDPTQGRVLLAGRDLKAWPLDALRAAVGLATPGTPLLRGSLRHNLLYRTPGVTAREFEQITQLCGIDAIARELPRGWDTRLGHGGGNLSAGERQRVSLARTLMGSPPLLLLDEPDAYLDEAARQALTEYLETYAGTVLIASHGKQGLPRADLTWHLHAGRRVETQGQPIVTRALSQAAG